MRVKRVPPGWSTISKHAGDIHQTVKETTMRTRVLPGLVLLCLVAAPWAARAADDKKDDKGLPAFVVRTKSLDGLLDDFKYLAELAGKEDEAKLGLDFFKKPGGINGFDV